MWSLYNMAITWRVRPSEMLNIENTYHAWCLDEAVYQFGGTIHSRLDRITGKDDRVVNGKRQSLLLKLLGAPDEARFKSVANFGKR